MSGKRTLDKAFACLGRLEAAKGGKGAAAEILERIEKVKFEELKE